MKTKDKNQLLFDFIEKNEILPGCVYNIKEMLPNLFQTQIEDVAAAEKRFEEGKGYLFTNGTGTGKTYVGLGIAKRFFEQDKMDILIVVPTQKKCIDWIEEAINFNLRIHPLEGINDKGFEVSITTFENYYKGNKFDKIAMNPPFGNSGKTAMEHVDKACNMLRWSGGELLAIIPNGPSMNKRLDDFFNHPDNSRYRLTGEVILPTCTFERAGTSVNCKIIRIQDGYHQGNYKPFSRIDLSYIHTTEEFFNELEHLEF